LYGDNLSVPGMWPVTTHLKLCTPLAPPFWRRQRRILQEDEIVDVHHHAHIDKANIFVYDVALLFHELSVFLFTRPAVYIFYRQCSYIELMKRNRPQNL